MKSPMDLKNMQTNPFDVIALAASAGGHAALSTILQNLPADFAVPIIIMQHLSPDSTNTDEFYQRLETMNEGFCVVDVLRDESGRAIDLLYLELNPAFEQQTGLVREQVVGRPLSEVFTPADVNQWVPPFARVADTEEPATIEEYTKLIDRWHEGSMYPRGGDRVAVFYRDITARKQAEQALQARNDELERVDRVTIAHELQMFELKKQVNELRQRLGEPPSYVLDFESHQENGQQ